MVCSNKPAAAPAIIWVAALALDGKDSYGLSSKGKLKNILLLPLSDDDDEGELLTTTPRPLAVLSTNISPATKCFNWVNYTSSGCCREIDSVT